MKTTAKLQTIDEVCGKPPGSFQQSLKEKASYLKSLEQKRKDRIKASRVTAQQMAWAA
jgi:hypothetical protein